MKANTTSYPTKEKTKQIIFMRHGRVGRFPTKTKINYLSKKVRRYIDSESNYEELGYQKFMQLMLHKVDLPLAKYDNKINIKRLPKDIEVIFHSPAKRSRQTAEYIRKTLNHNPLVSDLCAKELAEVKFSDDIVSKKEFDELKGLSGCRKLILKRWFDGKNKAESFKEALERAENLYHFLMSRPEKTILVVTHGWYLRLLKLSFKEQTPVSIEELYNIKPLRYGEFFAVTTDKGQPEFSKQDDILVLKWTPEIGSSALCVVKSK